MTDTNTSKHCLSTNSGFRIEILKAGSGPLPILAFHGFGRSASDWLRILPGFGKDYTLYAVNLFYHEKSTFPKNRTAIESLTKAEFASHIKLIQAQFNFSSFAVAGYSLGGKLALLCSELFQEELKQIWLFAPDGIVKNFWYSVASNTSFGRRTYTGFLKNPNLFFVTVNRVHKWGIINDKMKKFAIGNMVSQEQRQLVQDVWLAYRWLNPKMPEVIESIKTKKIPVYQFFGKRDTIIKPALGRRLARAINQEQRLFLMDCGHWLFRESVVEQMKHAQTEKGC